MIRASALKKPADHRKINIFIPSCAFILYHLSRSNICRRKRAMIVEMIAAMKMPIMVMERREIESHNCQRW